MNDKKNNIFIVDDDDDDDNDNKNERFKYFILRFVINRRKNK